MSLKLAALITLLFLSQTLLLTAKSGAGNVDGTLSAPGTTDMGCREAVQRLIELAAGYWTITITTRGNGTTDKVSQSVPVGTDLQVTALETAVGSEFDHWESDITTIDGSRVNPITVPSQLDQSTHTLTAVFVTATHLPTTFNERAVWIQNAAWPYFPINKQYVLTQHLDEVVADLKNNNITIAFVFVGYWTAPATLTIEMTDAQITAVINALHAVGIKVLAWAENDGEIDVSPDNRDNLYSVIASLMAKGFDGYHDDIESPYTGTLQDWIDYENSCTTLLHGSGKLMTAAVPYDWEQNVNPYLYMDYIVTMFYSSVSTCEEPEARAYWQENFGQYEGNYNPPGSPVIIGLMNYYGNQHSLAWQLDWVTQELALDPHPQLTGFCLWLYEYMTVSDWQTWEYWMAGPVIPEFSSFLILPLFMAATLLGATVYKKKRVGIG